MKRFGIAALASATIAAGAARAAPIDEVGPWIAKFQASIAAGRFDEMAAGAEAVAAPQIPPEGLQGLFDDLAKRMGDEPVDFTEVFDERDLGDLFKRATIAAHYRSGYLFYAVTFVRDSAGWQLLKFDWTPNVNKILAVEWPK